MPSARWLRPPPQPPAIRERYLHEFDLQSSFFDSLREGYDGFNKWYKDGADARRRCWSIADDTGHEIHAICIYKAEEPEAITDGGLMLAGKILKLCTLKVGETIQGKKIGERLLFTAFKYAAENGFDWVYVHTDPTRHGHLFSLLTDYGFKAVGRKGRDVVYIKPMRPGLSGEPRAGSLSALEYAIQYYPHYRSDPPVGCHLVPIQPAFQCSGSEPMRDSILISIHPEFVDKILSGEKRFEFRRKVPSGGLRRMVIYATSPVMQVVAVAEVKSVVSDRPDRLWRATRQSAGISKEYFSQYFDGRDIAHAIELGSIRKLKTPKALAKICSSVVAPQSYRFVDDTFLKKL